MAAAAAVVGGGGRAAVVVATLARTKKNQAPLPYSSASYSPLFAAGSCTARVLPPMIIDALVQRVDRVIITGLEAEAAAAAVDSILGSGQGEEVVVGMILRRRIRNLQQRKVKVGGLGFGPAWRGAQPLGTRQRQAEATTDKKHIVPAPAGEQVPPAHRLLADQIPSRHPLRDTRAPGLVQQAVDSLRRIQIRSYY